MKERPEAHLISERVLDPRRHAQCPEKILVQDRLQEPRAMTVFFLPPARNNTTHPAIARASCPHETYHDEKKTDLEGTKQQDSACPSPLCTGTRSASRSGWPNSNAAGPTKRREQLLEHRARGYLGRRVCILVGSEASCGTLRVCSSAVGPSSSCVSTNTHQPRSHLYQRSGAALELRIALR